MDSDSSPEKHRSNGQKLTDKKEEELYKSVASMFHSQSSKDNPKRNGRVMIKERGNQIAQIVNQFKGKAEAEKRKLRELALNDGTTGLEAGIVEIEFVDDDTNSKEEKAGEKEAGEKMRKKSGGGGTRGGRGGNRGGGNRGREYRVGRGRGGRGRGRAGKNGQ